MGDRLGLGLGFAGLVTSLEIRSLKSLGTVSFHSNYGRIFSRFDTIHEREIQPASRPSSHRTTA